MTRVARALALLAVAVAACPAAAGDRDDEFAIVNVLAAQIAQAEQERSEILERIRSHRERPDGLGPAAAPLLLADGPREFYRGLREPTLPDAPDGAFAQRFVTGPWPWSDRAELLEWALDADRDGRPEELRYLVPYQGRLVHRHRDRDLDGRMDSWLSYESGALVRRDLDETGDGRWDQREFYTAGVLTRRDVDRDLDGVADARLLYRDDWLVAQEFDPDNDGVVDVRVVYDRGEVRERHHDVDGDGRIDVVSFYEQGKLRRRELRDPDIEDLVGATLTTP